MNEELPPLTELSYDLPQVWDSSSIVAFRRCKRYFQNAYINHVRGSGIALPLLFGGTFAKGLETYRQAYYRHSGNHSIAFEKAYLAMLSTWGDNNMVINDDKRSFDRCAYALQQYFVQWPIETDLLQPHMSNNRPTFEYSFAIPLDPSRGFPVMPNGEPFIIAGRLDTLGTYDGLPIFADEKTTIVMGPKWADQWYTRHQFLLYRWALRELGFKAQHVMVRGICIRKDEVAFEQTPPIHIPDHLVDKVEHELKGVLADACMMADLKWFQKDFGEACYSHFRVCPYWHSCAAKPQNELGFLKTLPRNRWDPLKVVEIEEAA